MKPLTILLTVALCVGVGDSVALSEIPATPSRTAYKKQLESGNFKDAYNGFRQLALDPADDPASVGDDLSQAASALSQLGRIDELDDFREAVIQAHPKNWRLLWTAAETYLSYDNYGFIIAGKFYRGQHRGGGEPVNSLERDRVRALQLMVQAMPLAAGDPAKSDVAGFYLDFARLLLSNRGYDESWRLQRLTPLDVLPDYSQGWYSGARRAGRRSTRPAIRSFITCPRRLPKRSTTANDGAGRWPRRWNSPPSRENEIRWQLADFLQNQFGVQTMADYGRFFALQDDDAKPVADSPFALDTLADDETIAHLATGIERFTLPAEFDFIEIYEQIADQPQTGYGPQALEQLAQIEENRRQYVKAAEFWRRVIKQYGPGDNNNRRQRLDQIIGNWGRFEPIMAQPAGPGARVDFRFRNGRKVSFEAREIKVAQVLADVKTYLKSRPPQLDWQKINIGDIGYRLVQENQQQYLGAKVAAWDLELKPRSRHFDRRITVATPLKKAGAYLLTAKMADGNTSQIILWLNDTVIVKKPLDKGMFYFVADAVTGQPIPQAKLEFFGFHQVQIGDNEPIPTRYRRLRRRHRRQWRVDPPSQARRQSISMADHGHRGRRSLGLFGLYERLVSAISRRRIQPDQGLHDHRSARLSARAKSEVQILDSACQVRPAGCVGFRQPKLHRRDPRPVGHQDILESLHDGRLWRHGRRFHAPRRRQARHVSIGRRQLQHGRQLSRRGVQKARIRGEDRRSRRAGHARRENQGHDPGQVLFRRAGRQGPCPLPSAAIER